ncbi:hypothetical protein [Fodinicola feengrottensis]|nr:hypothetical protein [Fodinicola feengrottensis]
MIGSLLGYLAFALPHAIFHATHLEHFQTGDAIAQTILLFGAVLIPLLLLIPALRIRPTAGKPGKSPDTPAGSSPL